jgi:hypothetical protein
MRLLVLAAVAAVSAASLAFGELPFTEDCVSFNIHRIDVQEVIGRDSGPKAYLIRTDGGRMMPFPTVEEGRRALTIIRRYAFDRVCYLGRPRPSFMYWKSGDTVPARLPESDEDCQTFATDAVRVGDGARGRPYILWDTSGAGHVLGTFGSSSEEARQALQVVRNYELSRACYVGRPDPSMTYWLSSGRSR